MSSQTDLFKPVTVGFLRGLAISYYPNQGASRMQRSGLVDLLSRSMLEEEIEGLQRAARRPLEECDSIDHIAPSVHRRMVDKFGRLFPLYKNSAIRHSDERLSRFLQVADATVAMNESEHSDTAEPPGDWVVDNKQSNAWPQPVPQALKNDCLAEFRTHTGISVGATCSVCARRIFAQDLLFNKHLAHLKVPAQSVDLSLLTVTDPHIRERPAQHFQYGDATLDNLMLEAAGVHVTAGGTTLDMCSECHAFLTKSPPKLPPLALANGLLRGYLPADLQDLTWLEERLCAKYLASAYVIRLYDFGGAEDQRSRAMKGHACSFPLNTVSTAVKLPWTLDGSALVSCIVIGPRKPRIQDLRGVFKVRKAKVRAMLLFLREHFKDYPQFPIDEEALGALPLDDVPELIARHVIYQAHDKVASLFDQETTGLEAHPALIPDDDSENTSDPGRTFLEHHGLLDVNGLAVPAHQRAAAALANATGTERPDLVVRHGSAILQDYNNPALFPGMFPTLYPWGIGGFEGSRPSPVSFARHAKLLLDLTDPSFRRHWSFIFVVANIKQRRAVHLGSRLVCRARDHARFTNILSSINQETVVQVAEHLSRGGTFQTLNEDERAIHEVLRKCQLVSANVPGSKAVMDRARSDIRAYVGQFGIFQLFLTLNPAATHSPVFQVFYGDRSVTLDVDVPILPSAKTRAMRVADDPVAASDFFHFHVYAVFRFLLGWDIRKGQSTPAGGLFGRLAAFFLVKEHTMRGHLHCHTVIWLEGGLNPSILHQRMKSDEEFKERYLAFFDDLIAHGLPGDEEGDALAMPDRPGSNVAPLDSTSDEGGSRKPRQERPPCPSDPNYTSLVAKDLRLLVNEVQRHKCTFTCFKGGRESCRFLFPHPVNSQPSFDPDSNSINLRVLDPMVNWYNDMLLVATRHNQDLKLVLSGKSGVAAASYITSYATKSEETPANQVSMIRTVYERMAKLDLPTSDAQSLLTRCVMQFGRERQLHAQQAATYVRDLGDVLQSHVTVPMLSGALIATALKLFGPLRSEDDAQSSQPQQQSSTTSDENDYGAQGEEEDSPEGYNTLPLTNSGLAHQVDDYLHRGTTLSALSFYDFVGHVRLIRKPKKLNKNHHKLLETHPNVANFCHRYNAQQPLGIPRAICTHFPRRSGEAGHGDAFCAAMLAHFVPFGLSSSLKTKSETWESAFGRADLPPHARRIIANWDALRECEDARDGERLLRRKRAAARSMHSDDDGPRASEDRSALDNPNADLEMEDLLHKRRTESPETRSFTSTLTQSGWFDVGSRSDQQESEAQSHPHVSPSGFSRATRQAWAKEQALLEAHIKATKSVPKAAQGVLAQQLGLDQPDGCAPTTSGDAQTFSASIPPLPTQRQVYMDATPDQLLQELTKERKLTPSQALAFMIAGRRFFEEINGVPCKPLRLLMHGEAGTGKTVVVRLLRELMDRYGRGAEIMFMAPTGKAASAIGGVTQHAAFNIDIQRRGLTQEELQGVGSSNEAKRLQYLQRTFRSIRWIFFDEVSMTSCEVFAQIDQALRLGTQRQHEPFGGINVLFAGDLCQLPPVASAPLYTSGAALSLSHDTRTLVELGRTAWLQVDEVVEFTEQMRMQDQDMAAALRHLRVRQCTDTDAALFNANVLKSAQAPHGVSVRGKDDLIVLARTNETVRALNRHKASIQASTEQQHLVISHAVDKASTAMTAGIRDMLLAFDCTAQSRTGIGRLPLFTGMPVIFRGSNQSIGLGVTNGALGVIVDWDLVRDRWGFTVVNAAIVQFDPHASWSLSGLPNGCLPVYPTSSTFNFPLSLEAGGTMKVSRRQLPLQPGFAMTTHSAQGITSPAGVIVDLRRGGFESYVAASRATCREHVFLVHSVTKEELNKPPLPSSLTEELKRLHTLAERTKRAHGHDQWRLQTLLAQEQNSELSPNKRRRLT